MYVQGTTTKEAEKENRKIIQETDESTNKILLCSYATAPFIGEKGTGKTVQMNIMAQQYIKALPITSYFYITKEPDDPNIVKCDKIQILKSNGRDGVVDEVCEEINAKYQETKEMFKLQDVKQKVVYRYYNKEENKIITREVMELKYKKEVDEFKANNPDVVRYGRIILPQTILIIDDLNTDKIFSNPKGQLFEILINQRHCGVQLVAFSVHSIVSVNKQIREQYTQCVLFDGIEKKRLQTIFYEFRLGKTYFTFQQFYDIYSQFIEQQKGAREMSHQFLYVTSSPVRQITVGWFVSVDDFD